MQLIRMVREVLGCNDILQYILNEVLPKKAFHNSFAHEIPLVISLVL